MREKFLLLDQMHCLAGQVMRVCRMRKGRPNIMFKGAQLSTIAAMVSADLGVSIVPQMMAASDAAESRVYRRLHDPQPRRDIMVAWNVRRYRTRPAAIFAQCVTEALTAGIPGQG